MPTPPPGPIVSPASDAVREDRAAAPRGPGRAPPLPLGSLVALLAGAVAIGFAPIFVRLSPVGPVATAFWRVVLALPLLALWAGASRRRPGAAVGPGPGPGRAWPEAGLLARLALTGAFFAGDLAIWHWSIRFTTVANATLLANFAAIFVALAGWLFFGARISRGFLGAMVLALAGTVLLVGKNARFGPQTVRGDLLGLASALFYAGYLLSVKFLRGGGEAVGAEATRPRRSTAVIMTGSGIVTALVLTPLAAGSGERFWPGAPAGWWPLVGLALVSHVGGQSLIAYALAGLPAPFASLALLVQPATAAAAAWWLLGEPLGPGQLLGGVILLAGLVLARREGGALPAAAAAAGAERSPG